MRGRTLTVETGLTVPLDVTVRSSVPRRTDANSRFAGAFAAEQDAAKKTAAASVAAKKIAARIPADSAVNFGFPYQG